MKISELVQKNYSYETKYQRDSAWLKKTQNLLIDSVINNYFVPQILIANNEVVDGKQRLLTLKAFYHGEFKWVNQKNPIKIAKNYYELSEEERFNFENGQIDVKNLGDNLTEEIILETFIRINEGSIKLNKIERIMAKSTPRNRYLVKKIVSDSKFKELANRKNYNRYKLEGLIIRSLTILSMLNPDPLKPNIKRDVRGRMEPFMKNGDIDNTCLKKSIQTIDLMYLVIGLYTIPIKVFNTVFESIFCSFYLNLESENAILNNKNEIKEKIDQKIQEIIDDQMGGGTRFDSILHVKTRIDKINKILFDYHLDYRRSYTKHEKQELWKLKEHICEICSKEIETINSFEIDHHKPYSLGGPTILQNARILCHACNNREGQKTKQEIRLRKSVH